MDVVTAPSDPALDRLVRRVVEVMEPVQVWLFGSRAEGRARPDSDYDLLVVVPDDASDERFDPLRVWQTGGTRGSRGHRSVHAGGLRRGAARGRLAPSGGYDSWAHAAQYSCSFHACIGGPGPYRRGSPHVIASIVASADHS